MIVDIVAAATETPPLDPTIQVLLTIFGAALVTAAAGFVGAWWQSRREHQRWLREERLRAYLDWLSGLMKLYDLMRRDERTAAKLKSLAEHTEALDVRVVESATQQELDTARDELTNLMASTKRLEARDAENREQMKVLRDSLMERTAAFSLLGPDYVMGTGPELREDFTADQLSDLVESMTMKMRKALDINR